MKKAKKLLSVILSIALVLSMVPVSTITAKAADDSVTLDISNGIIVIDSDGYTQGDEEKVEYTGAYIITGEYASTMTKVTAVTVSAGANVDITIKDLSISATGNNSCAFWIKSAYSSTTDDDGTTVESITYTTVNLTIEGENSLISGMNRAGLSTSMYSTLIIDGDGYLYAKGLTNGAGIGGSGSTEEEDMDSPDPDVNIAVGGVIVIKGGTIYAVAGKYGAGIGDGDYGGTKCSPTLATEVYIIGGVVYAYTSTTNSDEIKDGETNGNDSASGIGRGGDPLNVAATFSTTYEGVTGNAVIYTSSITDSDDTSDWSGIIFTGTTGVVYGDVTLEDYTLPEGYTLTVAEGASLTITGTLDVSSGTFYNLGTVSAASVTGDVYCSITFAEDSEIAISEVTFTGTKTTSDVVYALAGSDVTIANMTNEDDVAASWLSDTEDITFTYGDDAVTFTMPYTNVVLTGYYGDRDTTAPAIEGVEDGASYEGDVTFTVADENLRSVKVDGVTTTTYTISADDATHIIVATDKAGNVTTVSVTVNKVVEATTEESTTETSTTEEPTTEAPTTEATTTEAPTATSAAVGTVLTDSTGSSYKVTVADASPEVTLTKAGSGLTGTVTVDTVTVDGVTYKVTAIDDGAFKGNKNITNLTIGNNVKTIGASAFESCTKLKSVTIGTGLVSIAKKAFFKCTALTSVTVNSTVLVSIGASAFEKCTKLKSFKSVSTVLKKIGKKCFNGDKKLKKVTLKTTRLTKKTVKKAAFKGIAKKCTFKVPKKKIKAYKALFVSRGAKSTIKVKK